MIFRQKCLVDRARLKQRRQRQAIENNKKENKNRREHNYKVGDLVLIIEKQYERAKRPKISSPAEVPFKIIQVYQNGNVRIRREGFDEDISIRRLRPYFQSE